MKRLLSFVVAAAACIASTASWAQPAAIPPNILATNNLPMVMLSASKDFTMFWKAYTDFDDIDFDGVIDRTFMPGYKYYGYFDPAKCYSYDAGWDPGSSLGTGFKAGSGRFEPKSETSLKTITISGKSYTGYYCSGDGTEWSGNFLNWVSMSRIDVLRKVLYGGLRAVDKDGETTLELSFVPRNSQAFVKYYNDKDLPYLTAYNGTDAKNKGLTFCRRPKENSGTSHSSSFIPEIRVAVGNVILWNMTEVRTCNWSSEIGYTWKADTITYLNNNYETPAGTYGSSVSDHQHLSSVPSVGGDNKGFVGRIKVCDPTLLGTENCKNYGTASTPKYKPKGLLQEFGESLSSGVEPARAEFGLMMGSYDNNLQGGVLRKNMSQINDEIDPATGQFVTLAAGAGGIIRSFNEITLYDYDVGGGNYGTGSCPSDKRYSSDITNGNCPSWGNPVGELLLESMRYYAGKSALYTKGTKDDAVGLPSVSSWKDPVKDDWDIGTVKRSKLYGQAICRPMNMLTITSGSNSFDDNTMSSFSDLGASDSAATVTTLLGSKEGVNGTVKLVGETSSSADGLCTGKTISGLGDVKGICADGPNFRGTYLGAGVAYYANTNNVRSDFTSKPADLPGNALKVRSYGISMSGGVATITVPTHDGKKVFITPASRDQQGGKTLPGNMVDFKVIKRSTDGKSGAALVLWQHNMLGEDQDQDMLGVLRWEVDSTVTPWRLKVYTRAVESDTGSGAAYAFGYTVVGTKNLDDTSSDGVHFHSGINSAPTTEPNGTVSLAAGTVQGTSATDTSVCGGRLCSIVDDKTTRGETYKTYKMVGDTDALLKEPLWYISKYGGFKYDGKKYTDLFPTATNPGTWDVKRADGLACGGSTGRPCNDGEPDNYFVARSPELLETSLREILEDIVNSSNTSPAIASSQLQKNDLKYVAKFDSGDGRGELSAYAIDPATGLFFPSSKWDAHTVMKGVKPADREIIFNEGTVGTAFQWSALTTAKKDILRSGITDITKADAFAQEMLAWLRGDTSNTSQFRVRAASSILGPIVNSNPTVQTPPNANYFGDDFSGYGTFVSTWKARKSILWVGAGDGMLHGFDASSGASGGAPVMSYIPEPVFSRLPDWANASKPKVQAFVDGSPFVGDVKIGSTWSTYLFGTLGRGGKGIFALDVTDPDKLKEATASTVFKWQFTASDDASDLGYIVSEPTVSRFSEQAGQIARMNNGKFAAIFGNGVMSASGKAVLYILFADGPSSGSWSGRFIKITADSGSGNGLSQPIWIDNNNDGIADVIYAGDMKGNLWKFDVSSSDTTKWQVAHEGEPLFVARDSASNRLPITSAPEFKFHPLGGVIVTFATGKSIESGDFPNTTRTNGIFGVWDSPAIASMTVAARAAALPIPISKLEDRTFNNVTGSDTDRYVKGIAIDWSTKYGWKLPFNVSSEMSVSNASLANGQVIIVSVSPPAAKASPTDPDPCFAIPQARLSAIGAVSGLPEGELLGKTTVTVGSVTTTYSLGSIGISDQKVRISKDAVGIGVTGDCASGKLNCSRIVGEKTDKGLTSVNNTARVFWREIPGLKTRDWTK